MYLIYGNMLPLGNAGAFANTEVSDDGKEEDSDEEVLEVEEPGGDGDSSAERTLFLNGTIAEESWFDDDVTPQLFKEELMDGSGDITVWINSPGGDCVAAAQIYNMLMDYPHNVTVKIDGIAAQCRLGHCDGWHEGAGIAGVHDDDPQSHDCGHG